MNEMRTGSYDYDEKSISFNFNDCPSYSQKVLFVNSVVDTIVGDNYNYIIKDLIFDFMIISIFTDIDTAYIEDCDDFYYAIELIDELVNNTNVASIVKNNMGFSIISELEESVDKGIEYKTGMHGNVINDSLASLINTVEEKLKDFNLSSEDVMKMVPSFINMGEELSAEKILDAYSKTDMFKRQFGETADAKEK